MFMLRSLDIRFMFAVYTLRSKILHEHVLLLSQQRHKTTYLKRSQSSYKYRTLAVPETAETKRKFNMNAILSRVILKHTLYIYTV